MMGGKGGEAKRIYPNVGRKYRKEGRKERGCGGGNIT